MEVVTPPEYRASNILLEVIDPTKIIRQECEVWFEKKGLSKQHWPYFTEQYASDVMNFYEPILILRERATRLIEKGREYVDSHCFNIAEKMRRAVLLSTQEWIQNKSGRVLRIPFNYPPPLDFSSD